MIFHDSSMRRLSDFVVSVIDLRGAFFGLPHTRGGGDHSPPGSIVVIPPDCRSSGFLHLLQTPHGFLDFSPHQPFPQYDAKSMPGASNRVLRRKCSALLFSAFLLSHLALIHALRHAAEELPAKVATHFNATGAANGWMSRESYPWVFGGLGLGLSFVLLAFFYGIRFRPVASLQLPHREHWLSAQNRERTFDALMQAGMWLATFIVLFFYGIHRMIVAANAIHPAQLSSGIWYLVLAFLCAIGLWIYLLQRYFRVVKKQNKPAPQQRATSKAR